MQLGGSPPTSPRLLTGGGCSLQVVKRNQCRGTTHAPVLPKPCDVTANLQRIGLRPWKQYPATPCLPAAYGNLSSLHPA